MGILNRWFGTKSKLQVTEQEIEDLWEEHKRLFIEKSRIITGRTAKEKMRSLLNAFKTHFFDIREVDPLFEKIQADMHNRIHARDMQELHQIRGALYREDTIHDYTHAVLAKLHVNLVQQANLVQAYKDDNKLDEQFYFEFTDLLKAEGEIIDEFSTYLHGLAKFVSQMLRHERNVGLTEHEQKEYNKIEAEVRALGIRESTLIHKDFQTIREYIPPKVQEFYESEEIQSEDPEEVLWEELDVRYINRPQFLDEVQSLLEHTSKVAVPQNYTVALVAHIREHFHREAAKQLIAS